MHSPFLLLACTMAALIAAPQLCAQDHKAGLILDDSSYQQAPRLAAGIKAATISPMVSMRENMPGPGDQGSCNSCVGWAAGYACLTASLALKNNITAKEAITHQANSAMYLYDQAAYDCNMGSRIETVLMLMKKQGDCLLKDFNPPAFARVPGNLLGLAEGYRIRDWARLFDINADSATKVEQTKLSLENHQPVIVGLRLYASLHKLGPANPVWTPDSTREPMEGGHALCVVGYNDYNQTFELVNSWGDKWGREGYCFIRYRDFPFLVRYAFQLTLDTRKKEDDPISVSGSFALEKYLYWDTLTDRPVYREMRPRLEGNEYRLSGSGFRQYDRYRVLATGIRNNCYIYVFSINPRNEATVLFPFGKSAFAGDYHVDALVQEIPRVYARTAIEIPGRDKAIETDLKGDDYMCILYCYKQIPDIEDLANRVRAARQTTFFDRLKEVLGDRLMPSITYEALQMDVKGVSSKGDIVPIILKLTVQ